MVTILVIVAVGVGASAFMDDDDDGFTVTYEGSGTVTSEPGESGEVLVHMHPEPGWYVSQVTLNGEAVAFHDDVCILRPGASADGDRIHVVFAEDTGDLRTVVVEAGGGGTVFPSGEIRVRDGGTLVLDIVPDAGRVAEVTVSGGPDPVLTDGGLSLTVDSDMTVSVTFSEMIGGAVIIVVKEPLYLTVEQTDPDRAITVGDRASDVLRVIATYEDGSTGDVTFRTMFDPSVFDDPGLQMVTAMCYNMLKVTPVMVQPVDMF